jgi:glycosyltransferase involved in cell wall biosynthesis
MSCEIIKNFVANKIPVTVNSLNEITADVPIYIKKLLSKQATTWELMLTAMPMMANYKMKAKTIVFSMWESSILPKHSISFLNQAALVIAPSKYNKDIFVKNGVHRPTSVIPLGINTSVYSKINTAKQNDCTFGIAGINCGRKNIPFVLDAFIENFSGTPAIMKVKTSGQLDTLKQYFNHPQINIASKSFSEAEMCQWYNSLDAFVNCAHSEGFGLHQLEAMSCGVPLMSPKFGGVAEYFDEEVGYCVDYKMVKSDNRGDWVMPSYEGEWAESKKESLIKQMIRVYNNRQEASNIGIVAMKRASTFTWERCAANLAKNIDMCIRLNTI